VGLITWVVEPYASTFMRQAAIAALCVGVVAPVVGVWVVLQRLAYLGDALSHATLGGVAAAHLVGWPITLGALVAGVAMGLGLAGLGMRRTVGNDAAIGVLETVFFAGGIILIARSDGVGVELNHYLLGQLLTVSRAELAVNVLLTIGVVTVVIALFGDLRMAAFDPTHAAQAGLPVRLLHLTLLGLLSVTVVVCLSTVGLLLSVALLVTPATAARLLCRRLVPLTIVAVAIGVASSLGGLTLSYHLATPPGATIALIAAVVFFGSFLVTLPRRSRLRHG
jgi:ABC-type Mn2+/Zn2+ transport system permease subunit